MSTEPNNNQIIKQLEDHHKLMTRIDSRVTGMQTVLTDVAVALTKIANLEEHKQETKKDVDNLYALNRKVDKEVALIQRDIAVIRNDTSRNTKWVERALSWLVMAGLVASQLIGK